MVIQNVAANVYYLVSDLVRRDDVLGARSVLVGLKAREMLRRGTDPTDYPPTLINNYR